MSLHALTTTAYKFWACHTVTSFYRYLRKVDCSSFAMCLLLALPHPRAFLHWPLRALIRQTRWAVCAINHSILWCLCLTPSTLENVYNIDIDTCELNLPRIFEQSNNHRFIVIALFCSIGLWYQQIGLYLFLLSRPRSQGKDKACYERIQLMIKQWMSIPGTCQYCSSFSTQT